MREVGDVHEVGDVREVGEVGDVRKVRFFRITNILLGIGRQSLVISDWSLTPAINNFEMGVSELCI